MTGQPTTRSDVTICTPAGDVGYGFDAAQLIDCVSRGVDAIAVQGTSTDPGPYYLGTGTNYIPDSGVVRDLCELIPIALDAGVPLLASIGGSGTNEQVDHAAEAIRRWANASGRRFRLALIKTSVSKDQLRGAIREGRSVPAMPEAARHLGAYLTVEQVDAATNVVVQVGPEPFMRALEESADVVISGRALDVALFAAVPLMRGIDPGVAYLMAKTLECGAQVAEPGSLIGGAVATASGDRFTISPLDPAAACTTRSVFAHVVYEESDGTRLHFPGGSVDLSKVRLDPRSQRTVEVSGARWVPRSPYALKIEGARRVGFRAVVIAGVKDSRVADAMAACVEGLKTLVAARFDPSATIEVQVYGSTAERAADLGVLIDVIASDGDAATEIANYAKGFLMHVGFPGRRTTSGNLALAFSPNVIPAGPVFEFNIFHLLAVDDPEQYSQRLIEWVGGSDE